MFPGLHVAMQDALHLGILVIILDSDHALLGGKQLGLGRGQTLVTFHHGEHHAAGLPGGIVGCFDLIHLIHGDSSLLIAM